MRRIAAVVVLVAVFISAGYPPARGQGPGIEKSVTGDIYFGTLSAGLDDAAKAGLDRLYAWLKENPGSTVLLAGYDDQRTEQKRSVELGWERAYAVRDYLVSQGADPAVIHAISFGNTKLAQAGEGEDVWARNRRVRYRVAPPSDDQKMEGMPSGVCQKCKR